MGLQIRVRHALGQRVIEVPDRPVARPVVVGRAANVEVQVPSAAVATKHCALFVHEGYWAIRDLARDAGGTLVNGEPLDGSRYLMVGDLVTLGSLEDSPTIEVDPAAAAAGRTGYAGNEAAQTSAPQAPPGQTSSASGLAGGYPAPAPPAPLNIATPGYGQAGYGQPSYAAPSYAAPGQYGTPGYGQPQAAPAYPPGHDPSAGYADPQAAQAGDQIDFQPTVSSRPYTGRRKQGMGAGPVVFMVLAVAVVGALVWYVLANRQPALQVIQKPDVLIVKRIGPEPSTQGTRTAPEAGKVVTGGSPTPSGGTPKATASANAGQAKSDNTGDPAPGKAADPAVKPPAVAEAAKSAGGEEPGMDPIPKRPAAAKAGTGDEGMDPIKKPANSPGGADEGMDMARKPGGSPPVAAAVPAVMAIPPGEDPETIPAAVANSFETMQKIADRAGKESFAVLRFEEFKAANPGKHDAEIDGFVEKKMDRIWWQRVGQLMTRTQKFDADMAKAKLDLLDVTNPDEKKKLIDGYKKMEAEKPAMTKTLREVMKYDSSEIPDLTNDAALTSLAGKRDKTAYENWKKATIVQIKANKGKLPWASEL